MPKTILPEGQHKTLHIDFSCGKSDGSNSAVVKMNGTAYRGTTVKFAGPCTLVFHPEAARLKYVLETSGEVEIEKL